VTSASPFGDRVAGNCDFYCKVEEFIVCAELLSIGDGQEMKALSRIPFQGTARALSVGGLNEVAEKLALHPPAIWTVLSVETSGCGFLPDRRPRILYERHIFHRLTHGKYDDGEISDSIVGGYGAPGAHQYDRLRLAMAQNRMAALQSCSWGIGQIMGENYAQAGFADVEQMVAAMSESEDRQLAAMGDFLIHFRLNVCLQTQEWASFARGYNGANYAINRYDMRLKDAYRKYSAGPLPDLSVRAAQLYLTYLGFHPGALDGVARTRTLAALADFRTQQGLANTGPIDQDTIAQLSSALGD
jgi:hypothetical protein